MVESSSISIRQNQDRNLERLAAQRMLYTYAKRIRSIQFFGFLVVPIVLVLLAARIEWIRDWVALYGIVAAILDATLLESLIARTQRQAARIQEKFDCEVLDLPWPYWILQERPDNEVVTEASATFKQKHGGFDALKNWYPTVIDQLPLHLARVICQRSNLVFDLSIRERYKVLILILLAAISILAVVLGWSLEWNVKEWTLQVLVPLLPAPLWCIREYRYQHDTSEKLRALRSFVNRWWDEILNDPNEVERLSEVSRRLQDQILGNRISNAPVSDWFYATFKSGRENQMEINAQSLVKQLTDKMQLKPPPY